MPSYALPTLACLNRISKTGSSEAVVQPRRDAPRPSTTTPKQPGFRRYRMSTVASRRKASQQPFRFLALPPELRNQVYGLCDLDKASRTFKLIDERADGWANFPALLRTNRQLLCEAGSLYFTTGAFDIQVRQPTLKLLFVWLKSLGPSGRRQISATPDVTIQILHTYVFCLVDEVPYCLTPSYCVTMLLAHLLPDERSKPSSERSPLSQWVLHGECPAVDFTRQSIRWATPYVPGSPTVNRHELAWQSDDTVACASGASVDGAAFKELRGVAQKLLKRMCDEDDRGSSFSSS